MQIVFYIMAFLTLSLSFVPCGDQVNTVEMHVKSELKNSAHQHSHSGADTCTPFCHCSCCSSLSVIQLSTISYISVSAEKVKSYHLPSKIFDAAIPVWQPPQLA